MENNHHRPAKKQQYAARYRRITSYTCKIWSMVVVCILLVIAASALIYFLLVKTPKNTQSIASLIVPHGPEWIPKCPHDYVKLPDRFDCYPENVNVNRQACESRGCCFLGSSTEVGTKHTSSVTRCVYPKNYGYKLTDGPVMTDNGYELSLQRIPAPSRFGDDIHEVRVAIEMQTPYRLRIKFYDAVSERYEVPTPKIPVSEGGLQKGKEDTKLYNVVFNSSEVPFALSVHRMLTGAVIFDTLAGALTLSHHFLELSTLLPSTHVYGLSASQQLDENLSWKTWTLFSRFNEKQRGVHPMYLCIENDGSAHGVLLLNSNAMEIKVLPTPAITFRTIGGILDFYVFLGPTPEDVVEQYVEAVGRPPLPPYWALGLHVGSNNFHTVDEVEAHMQQMNSVSLPFEVFHLGVDVLGLYSSGSSSLHKVSNLTQLLHAKHRRVLISVQPSVKVDDTLNSMYQIGLKHDSFIVDKWNLHFHGEVNGQEVVYANYGKSTCETWWSDVLQKIFMTYLPFDGISMINNYPLSDADGGINGCMNDDFNRPPYVPGSETLYWKTICMDAIQHWEDNEYAHYYLHNLYGHIMAQSTQKSLKLLPEAQRKLLMSRSTFVGSGHFVGHWLEEFDNSWNSFDRAIRVALDYNIYGIPLVGLKVCICQDDSEMGLRWMQLSLFFPLSGFFSCTPNLPCLDKKSGRNYTHSILPSVSQRYQLMPLLYSLFHEAHTKGSTIMRSLAHEFPTDNATYNIHSQFMWGSKLMICPVIKQGAKKLKYYLPQGIWYKLYTGEMFISKSEWFNETLDEYSRHNPAALFLRGGHIIVVQQPSETTSESRQNSMKLLVALNEMLQAEGNLYWDDGFSKDSIIQGKYMVADFKADDGILMVNVSAGRKGSRLNFNSPYVDHVQIMGLTENPKDVSINDYNVINKQKHWDPETKVLNIIGIVIPLEGRTELRWLA